jgi:hypothetical protein
MFFVVARSSVATDRFKSSAAHPDSTTAVMQTVYKRNTFSSPCIREIVLFGIVLSSLLRGSKTKARSVTKSGIVALLLHLAHAIFERPVTGARDGSVGLEAAVHCSLDDLRYQHKAEV